MTRHPLYVLCQSHAEILTGSLSDCLREADKRGFLRAESDGFYSLLNGGNIRIYRPGGHLGWIEAREVEAALKEPT